MTKKILVLGAGGLLGSWLTNKYRDRVIGVTRKEVDLLSMTTVEGVLFNHKPDVVINAAGIVRDTGYSEDYMWQINAEAPRKLSVICERHNIRFIHISTDCVFDGSALKPYNELHLPTPKDHYGRSKLMGEITDVENQLTIRTSFVGWPDPAGRGLLAWLFKQPRGSAVFGYLNVLWNGLTTNQLCDCLMILAGNTSSGLMHVTGPTITKYHMLVLANSFYNLGLDVTALKEPRANMLLETIRDDVPKVANSSGANTPSFLLALQHMKYWQDQIGERGFSKW